MSILTLHGQSCEKGVPNKPFVVKPLTDNVKVKVNSKSKGPSTKHSNSKLNSKPEIVRKIPTPEATDLKKELKDLLTELKSSDFSLIEERARTIYLAQSVWLLIFTIGAQNIEFTPEEKSEFGPLINSSLRALDLEISFRIVDFEPAISGETLVARSALQFLLDDYRDFPTQDNKLLEESLADLEESAQELSEELDDWKHSPWDLLDFKGPIPNGIPEHHIWWFQERQWPSQEVYDCAIRNLGMNKENISSV